MESKSLRNSEVSYDTRRFNIVNGTKTDDVSSKLVASLVSSQNNRRNWMEGVSNKTNNQRKLTTADIHCESIKYHDELKNTFNRDVKYEKKRKLCI